ncbi:MAG: flagellar hook-length control protein FliK [Thermodesulfovibrionales bacterium]
MMLPIMPGVQDASVTEEKRAEKTGGSGAESLFVSMLAGLFALPQDTPAATATENQVIAPDGNTAIVAHCGGDKNLPVGAEAADSLDLILAMTAAANSAIQEETIPQAGADDTAASQAFQSAIPSTQVKIAGSVAGNSDEKTGDYVAANLQPAKGDGSKDASSVAIPFGSRNTEGIAVVRHSAANRFAPEVPAAGSAASADANSIKQFSEGSAQAMKFVDGDTPERETSGEARIEGLEHNNISATHKTSVVPDGNLAGVDATVRHEGPQRLHQVAEAPRTITVQDQVFQVTRVNASKLEVTVQPEGLGKLNIEVNLNSGQIHARISASDVQTRDMLERNLPDIMNALAAEGHTIGGFSVGLRDGREHPQQGPAEQQRAEVQKVTAADTVLVRSVNNNLVSIFV